MTWSVIAVVAAFLTPLSFLPALWRTVRLRTADGVTVPLCLLGLVSYAAWLSVSRGVQTGMYVALVASAILAFCQFLYVRRWTQTSLHVLWFAAFAMIASFCAATLWPWLALIAIVPLDISWAVRAIIDVLRSRAAEAVSRWTWVMTTCAYTAWTVESFREGNTILLVQCMALWVSNVVAWAATVTVQRRASRGSDL